VSDKPQRVITLPELSLVLLIGASGSGKSSFARKHFTPTEIVSSDVCRGMVSDDENDQSATMPAFELLHTIVEKRLQLGRLTVVDATNVRREDRQPLIQLARRFHVLPVAIVLDLPARVSHERNRQRPDRQFGPQVVERQLRELKRGLSGLKREGFNHVYILHDEREIDDAVIRRAPLWTDKRAETGPFDVIGDIHGCADELEELLALLGYEREAGGPYHHPEGRRAVFVGDLADRGPRIVDAIRIAIDMVDAGSAFCVPGNHDVKLMRYLQVQGKQVRVSHGLEESIRQIEALDEAERAAFSERFCRFVDGLISHLVFDGGKLVVAHAGMKEEYIGRASAAIREFALFGETTGETDEFGLPVRVNWAADYKGKAIIVYGHTPTPAPQWLNRTINIDQGCVFGGTLTALRYPENELISVRAQRTWYEPERPFLPATTPEAPLQWQHDDVLDIEDFIGKHMISTSLERNVTIRAEHAAAALEVISRFAVDPRWLLYLPPTMSPSETSRRDGYLEHPEETFAFFRNQGVSEVVVEEKHMGSRAVLIICRDEDAALQSFGRRALGACYTRTGRPFLPPDMTAALLERLSSSLARAGLWEELEAGWVALDCEIMPWSFKAQELLRDQYGVVSAAAELDLAATETALRAGLARGLPFAERISQIERRRTAAERFREAWQRYCWEVASLDDIRIAPFHLLAAEARTFFDRDHVWHMETLARLATHDPLFTPTRWRLIDVTNDESVASGIDCWLELTSAGGEGFVAKPRPFIPRVGKRLIQPALKCRGPEYLRMIYGPDYDEPANLERLRQRGLSDKRGLALREFALGIEGLERFVRREPLRRVHECAFGVLALESEPVDPRL
jgi:protein phosphatase